MMSISKLTLLPTPSKQTAGVDGFLEVRFQGLYNDTLVLTMPGPSSQYEVA